MNEEIILKPSKAKWSGILLLCLMFVAVGAAMATHPRKESDFWIACLGIGFFGLGVIVSILQLFSGYSFLKISIQGILLRSLWHTQNFHWPDVEEFGVYKDLNFTYRIPIPYWRKKVGLRMSSRYLQKNKNEWGWFGAPKYDGLWNILLPDSYGMEAAELVKLLNDKKRQYTGKG